MNISIRWRLTIAYALAMAMLLGAVDFGFMLLHTRIGEGDRLLPSGEDAR